MKFLFRWLFRFFVLFLVSVVALILLKDVLLKSFAESWIRDRTGMDVKIGRLQTSLFSPILTVENFTLYNAAEFGGSPFLEIPDLYVEWDNRALLRRQLHLRLVRLTMTQVNIVEGKNGRTNFILGVDAPIGPGSLPLPDAGQGHALLGFDFGGIDTLNLTLGKIRYSSIRRPHQVAEVEVGMKNEVVTGLRTMADLAALGTRIAFRNGITITADPAAARPAKPDRSREGGAPTARRSVAPR